MIFTIGYSNRSLPEFLGELQKRHIGQLWDVRSSPWSRNAPFNGPQIEQWAEKSGIMYRQEGAILGGRSEIPVSDPSYIAALDRLLDAAMREPLAILCSEGDPAQCHRTWDIGASLLIGHGVVVRSILRNGREEDVTATLARTRQDHIAPELRDALMGQRGLFEW